MKSIQLKSIYLLSCSMLAVALYAAVSKIGPLITSAPTGNEFVAGEYDSPDGTHTVFKAAVHKDGTTTGILESRLANDPVFAVEYDQLAFCTDGLSAYLHGTVIFANGKPSLLGRQWFQKVTREDRKADVTAASMGAVANFATNGDLAESARLLNTLTSPRISACKVQVRSE